MPTIVRRCQRPLMTAPIREPTCEAVGPGEPLADDHLAGGVRLDPAPAAQVQVVEDRHAPVRDRDQAPRGRLGEAGDVEHDLGDDAGLHGRDAGELADPRRDRLGGARRVREDVGEAVAAVVARLGVDERGVRRAHRDEGGDAAHDDGRDGEDLPAQVPEVPHELAVDRLASVTRRSSAGEMRVLVRRDLDDLAAGDPDHPLGHPGDRGVVRDDDRQRAQLAVHALEHLEHELARRVVERAGRLVAEQHVRALGHRARDRHPLLLAAGELRREVVEAVAEADEPQRLGRVERRGGDLGDERHVLERRQARDQVVELEDVADVLAPEAGQLRVPGAS